MCIGVPATVIAVDGAVVTVADRGGAYRALNLEIADLAVGDPVLVLGGAVVRRLSAAAAGEISALLQPAIATADAVPTRPAPSPGGQS